MKQSKYILILLTTAVIATTAIGHDITMKNIKLDGMKITVGKDLFEIEPLPISSKTYETELKEGKPSWQGPLYTSGTSWRFRAMTQDSLKVYDGNNRLKEGTDYLVDYDWGTIGAIKGGKAISNHNIRIEYSYTSSRLDLVVRDKNGKLKLIKGKLDSRKPLLPQVPKNNRPLFSIYLSHNTTELTADKINIIDPTIKQYAEATGTDFINKKIKKLNREEPFTFVFFGDSITAQTDPKGGSFVLRFVEWLTEKYPQRKINYTRLRKNSTGTTPLTSKKSNEISVIMAGVPGNDSRMGLARMDKHVISHNPDLVIIMFGVNDENKTEETNNVSPEQYSKNLTTMIKKIRDNGGEPVLMTTSMKNLNWIATFGNLNEYAKTMRKVAKKNKVCLIDNYKAWENLPKYGYNYMIPLGSCINHPNDMGHQMFFEGLKTAFDGAINNK